jgi:hypothetical protein
VAQKAIQTSCFPVLHWRLVGTTFSMIRRQSDNKLQVLTCKLFGRATSIPVPTILMKTIQSVHFPLEVVTTISLEPNSAELYRFDAFERHVRRCDDCVVASNSHKFSKVLCSRGRYLAENMLAWVVGASDGHTYSTVSCRTRYIRVEIPRNELIPKLHKASRLIDREPESVVGALEPGECVEHVRSRIPFQDVTSRPVRKPLRPHKRSTILWSRLGLVLLIFYRYT